MRLTTALNRYKETRGERFPEERRTVSGSLTGGTDRLVHVGTDGSLRDYSDSLSELNGIDRSRLGIRVGETTRWFREFETVRSHYYQDTRLVETEFDAESFAVHQYDLTIGRTHLTHIDVRGSVPDDAELTVFVTMAPDGSDSGVGSLVHNTDSPLDAQVLEVYHRREHDYLTASTGLSDVQSQRPEQVSEILSDSPVSFPRWEERERRDQTRLTGDHVVRVPLDRSGRSGTTTLVSHLASHYESDRETALADLTRRAVEYTSVDALRAAARDQVRFRAPGSVPRSESVRTDLRVLELLSSPTGGHIAAPEFDPFYANSGGYGYVWFRDEASISRHLSAAGDRLGVATADALAESARFLCDAQLADGTWPHRVWADSGELAPGWANANVERDHESMEQQADQTATATAFLAESLGRDDLPDESAAAIRESIGSAVDALVDDVADNGLPSPCQNLWEDSVGQFTHTAATYVDAFATVAAAPLTDAVRDRSRRAAEEVLAGLDALWDDDLDAYVMRLRDGSPDPRLDSATLELATAFGTYDALEGVRLTDTQVDRLATHVDTVLDGLFRDPESGRAAGLIRYEGDGWRTAGQADPKVWSLTTGMGALAAVHTGVLLNDRGRNGDAYLDRGSDLYELLGEDGRFATDAGYLAEQVFDDGALDSATPLGWAHALRLHTTALLADLDALPTTAGGTEGPGEQPTWSTGEKYGIGTVADHGRSDPSRVWFTLTEGALTEPRFPQVDTMNLRTVDFLVRSTDGTDYATRTHRENRRVADSIQRRVEPLADDALLYRHVVTETGDGRGHEWQLTVEYAADPDHDAVLASVDFEARDGGSYELFAVATVALTTTNTEDLGIRYGDPDEYTLAARNPESYTAATDNRYVVDETGDAYSVAVAMATAGRFDWATVEAGGSDRLDRLFAGGERPESAASLSGENVVLVGRLGTGSATTETLAIGFARRADTAAALEEADGALGRGFETVADEYAEGWTEFLADTDLPASVGDDPRLADQYRTALMTLLAVEDKTYHGASIASPSVPWGEAVPATQQEGYGYNFVWSRDLYQIFTVFTLVGSLDVATDQLEYIYEYQQDESGFIPQNTYVNGATRWGGEQMDNISFPQVMAYQLWEAGVSFDDVDYGYENVRRSADYVARYGPHTAQERWEEEAGYSPSSIAAEIAGLICAAELAMETGHRDDALVWLALADDWVRNVEAWTATTTGTDRHTTTPYYTRITRNGDPDAGHSRRLANDGPMLDERNVLDGGFLELVRLGIVPADDPAIRNTVAEIDDTILVETPAGPGFYRYNGDGYGERARGDQGAPWSVEASGKGRLWPLLTGERGEYELGLGSPTLPAVECLGTMAAFANSGRMIAEQVWDREHATDYGWRFGEGTGSATPLAWSMAQYVRLAHGIDAGEPVATPSVVRDRYRDRALHDADREPDLRVDTEFRGNDLIVTGSTTGDWVVIRTAVDSVLVAVEDGTYTETVAIERGENRILVAAADGDEFDSAGTTVRQLRL
ncbi:glycoside hydrolase family 15 protein [Halobaculum lipolyticum]|uniref:Glycoside hydrolase family 15 protein n=1 Tax=Halobaculum lipolyticum TaxID=3032001 RepID=A0ABD5WA14_9EURY|nr:glycoside hydrolase family 15 protein [Halobaculum sp. DT31]